MSKIADSQRSFIYLELDDLYENSNLREPQKQEIYKEFKQFLDSVTDTSLLIEITDTIFELSTSNDDLFSDLLIVKENFAKKQQLIKS